MSRVQRLWELNTLAATRKGACGDRKINWVASKHHSSSDKNKLGGVAQQQNLTHTNNIKLKRNYGT